jgi:hypothetical protein
MARTAEAESDYVCGRWGRWFRWALDETGCSDTALASKLQLELDRASGRQLRSRRPQADLRERAPRSSVKHWREDGYATAKSAFHVGQALGRLHGSSVDGLQALYASGHLPEALACLDVIIRQAVDSYNLHATKGKRESWAATDQALRRLHVGLLFLVHAPIAYADFDRVDRSFISPDQCSESRKQLSHEMLELADAAWLQYIRVLQPWRKLMTSAGLQDDDFNTAGLYAWSSFLTRLTIRAQHEPILNERWVKSTLRDRFSKYENARLGVTPMPPESTK